MSVDESVIPQAKLEALEAQWKRIGVVTHPDGKSWAVVLRKPTRSEYKLFKANANNPATTPEAQEKLFKATCVLPEGQPAIEALLEEWPGIPEACGKTFQMLAGMSGVEEGKS
jgi:hypothetical protein